MAWYKRVVNVLQPWRENRIRGSVQLIIGQKARSVPVL